MQYNDWQTIFDEAVKFHPRDKDLPLHQRYDNELKRLIAHPFKLPMNRTNRIIRLGSEYAWLQEGRPYYKVHPGIVAQLAHVNLDNVPAKFIEVPNDFISVLIRFADEMPTIIKQEGQEVLLSVKDKATAPIGFRSVLFSRVKDLIEKGVQELMLHVDEGARQIQEGIECVLCNTIHLSIQGEESIPEAFDRTLNNLMKEDDLRAPLMIAIQEQLMQLFKVIVSIGFLSNNPTNGVIVPDVLNRDIDAFNKAVRENNVERQQQLIARAKRNHKHGWNVGTNEMFLPGTHPTSSREVAEPTGRELHWSHLRQGHWHPVRFGVGRERIMLKWFRTTRVRPDLPFKQKDSE